MAAITQRANKRWQAKVRREGWPSQSKTFQTKADAEAWARAIEREMDVGAFIRTDDAERTTFAKAADRYARELLPKQRGRDQAEYVLKRVVERFGPYSLMAITPALLSEYRDERLQAVSPQTVIHELGMVSRIFQAAAMDWRIHLPHGNPVALVRKPKLNNERTRRLENGEEQLLLAALLDRESPWPHAAAVLALETGARQGELLALRWSEVDLQRGVIRIRGKDGGPTKNGDPHRDVPVTGEAAVKLLEMLPRSTKDVVFPISQNALQIAWGRACRAARKHHVLNVLRTQLEHAGLDEDDREREVRAVVYKKREPLSLTHDLLAKIEAEDKVMVDLHFHDLRHEATSRMVEAEELSMAEIMKVLGHKSSRMLMRYYEAKAEEMTRKIRAKRALQQSLAVA